MATIVDSLLITLGLDGSDLEKSLSGVEQSIAGWVKSIVADVLDPLASSSAFGALLSEFTDAASALGKVWEDAFRAVGGETPTLQSALDLDNGANELLGAVSDTGLPPQYEGVASEWQDTDTAKKFNAATTTPQESPTVLSALIMGEVLPTLTLFDQALAEATKALDGFFARLADGSSVLSDLWSVFGTGEEKNDTLPQSRAELKKADEMLWPDPKDAAARSSDAPNQVVDTSVAAGPKVSDTSAGVFKTLANVVSGILSSIGGFFTGGFDSPEGCKKGEATVEDAEAKAPHQQEAPATNSPSFSDGGFWAGIKNSLSGVGESLKAFDNQMRSHLGGFVAQSVSVGASQGLSPALVAGAVHNNSETIVNVGGITVNAHSNDAVGIARETGEEIRRMVATANKGVRQ